MKYGSLVVFIRHDSAEIWGFRYGLTLAIGALKIMAGTGVLVRVVSALKLSIENLPSAPSIIFTQMKYTLSHSHQKMGTKRDFTKGGNAQNKQNANRE
jgi:hypothetical protein